MDLSSIDHHHLASLFRGHQHKGIRAFCQSQGRSMAGSELARHVLPPTQRQNEARIGDPLAFDQHCSIMKG